MNLHDSIKEELAQYARSEHLREDMKTMASNRHNPFLDNPDAYIEFVCQFNEFINHAPKPFAPMIEKDMKL